MNKSEREILGRDLDKVEDEMDELVQEKFWFKQLAEMATESLHAKRYEQWHINSRYYYTLLMFPTEEDIAYFTRTGCKICSPVFPDNKAVVLLAGHVKEQELMDRDFFAAHKM